MDLTLRQAASCMGIGGDFSILTNFFGLARGQVPPDREGGAGATVTLSVLSLASRLRQAQISPDFGDHFHLNIIRVGSDQFTDSELIEIDYAICRLREIYAGTCAVARIQHWDITTQDAGVFAAPTTESQLEDMTEKWEVKNNGVDVFFPFAMNVRDGNKITLGLSPTPGPGEGKDQIGMEAAVSGLWKSLFSDDHTARTLSHELGHYLGGLEHKNSWPTALMCQTGDASNVRTSVLLTTSQSSDIQGHDLVRRRCAP